jgi:hypothetical protein
VSAVPSSVCGRLHTIFGGREFAKPSSPLPTPALARHVPQNLREPTAELGRATRGSGEHLERRLLQQVVGVLLPDQIEGQRT